MKSSTPCLYLLIMALNPLLKAFAETCREVVAHFAVLVEIRFEEQCAEGRGERKGVDRRDTDGHGHRDAELRVEYARRSAHHG